MRHNRQIQLWAPVLLDDPHLLSASTPAAGVKMSGKSGLQVRGKPKCCDNCIRTVKQAARETLLFMLHHRDCIINLSDVSQVQPFWFHSIECFFFFIKYLLFFSPLSSVLLPSLLLFILHAVLFVLLDHNQLNLNVILRVNCSTPA